MRRFTFTSRRNRLAKRKMKMSLLIGFAFIIVTAMAVGVPLTLNSGGSDDTAESFAFGKEKLEVPIVTENAPDVGAMHIDLAYDPAVLKAVDVEKGSITGNAMIESSVEVSGWVIIEIVDSSGINGLGPLAVVTFELVGTPDMITPLELMNLEAWDAQSVSAIGVDSLVGYFRMKDRMLVPPIITFLP